MQQITQACPDNTPLDIMQIHCKQAFSLACEHKRLDHLKWLHENYPDTIACIYKVSVFNDMCKNGDLDIAQWFADTFDLLPSGNTFNTVCKNNHIQVAKWLVNRYTCIEPCLRDFLDVCIRDHTMFAQWLYDISPEIRGHDISRKIFKCRKDPGTGEHVIEHGYTQCSLFQILCEYGCFETAKFVHTIAPDSVMGNLFQNACYRDCIEVVQYMLDKCAHGFDHHGIYTGFLTACDEYSHNVAYHLARYTATIDPSCHVFGKHGYIESTCELDYLKTRSIIVNDMYIYKSSHVHQQAVIDDIKVCHAQKRIKSATK